jgi:hypothetical protein
MPGFLWLLPGVLLPLVTLGVELTTRMNSEAFFDPLPTLLHVVLVALVPAANFAAWWAARGEEEVPRRRVIVLANGIAIGVALFYTILFLPLVPLAFVAVMFYGMGLLPLTPLIALIAAIRLRVALGRAVPGPQPRTGALPGIALGVAALIALEIPATATRIGMQMAGAEDAATRARGIVLIRYAGSEDLLLRLCYVRSGLATDMVGFLFNATRPVVPEEARKIYYRVTGTPFNAVPAPVRARPRHGWFWGGDAPDFEQGGDGVAGKVRGLSLAASRIDGSADAEAALGYLEWTLVFRNASTANREARAQIGLPGGAVVSRLTLWIDGEEREAAFAGRAKVRQAYERIVRQNRDPVLVTTAGSDRVLMQLFPVPPGGEMKVRVGITLPLALRSPGEAALQLPHFHERNFDIAPDLRHAVWVESKDSSIRRALDDALLSAPASTLILKRVPKHSAWAVDSRADGHIVRQRLVEQPLAAPDRLVVVVDGSVAMRDAAPRIAQALERMPASIKLELRMAAEEAGEPSAQRLRSFHYSGGQDNVAALARALDRIAAEEKGALLWITGPQPVLLETIEPLLQRLERNPARPSWFALQVRPGPNLILEKLDGKTPIMVLHDDDLERLAAAWQPGATRLVAQRDRVKSGDSGPLRAVDKTSDHLARLWAHEQILDLARSSSAKARESAVSLAQQYRLVTPLSGAVVLETQRQYDEAGLEPAAPGTVPSIPEPEVWALLAAALLLLLHSCRKRFPIAA